MRAPSYPPPSNRVIRTVPSNYSSGRGRFSQEDVNQQMHDMNRETANPYAYNNRGGGYSRESAAPPPMNMAPPTTMAPSYPVAPPTPINMGYAPPLEFNMPPRLETPPTSLRLPVMQQNQVQYQQNPGGMNYGQNGAPAQLTYTGYTVGPNGVPQKVTTMETTTVSQVETTPTIEPPHPVEVNEAHCCCPRDSDDLHYSYSNLVDSLVGRMMRVLLLTIPISMIVLGYFYQEQCQIRPYIPHWLISTGIAWILHTLLYFLFRNNPGTNTSACRFVESVCFLLAAAWFITGSTWTYGSIQDVSFNMNNASCFGKLNTRSTTSAPTMKLVTSTHPISNWTNVAQQEHFEKPQHFPPIHSSTPLPVPVNCYCHPVPFIAASVVISLAYTVLAVLIFFVVFTFQYSYNLNPPSSQTVQPPPITANTPHNYARP